MSFNEPVIFIQLTISTLKKFFTKDKMYTVYYNTAKQAKCEN
jgi:hypothetical protein